MTYEEISVRWQTSIRVWQTEPVISHERQIYLEQRRALVPNVTTGTYSFRDIALTRADIEWLLATHEGGLGPVDWHDPSQSNRLGLDLRGADLRDVKLRGLPLARLIGGLTPTEWPNATDEQREWAAINLQGADLGGTFELRTHLEGSRLAWAHLERANLTFARMERSGINNARLENACLDYAHLEQGTLSGADLRYAHLYKAHLEGVNLSHAKLGGADVRECFFTSATDVQGTQLSTENGLSTRISDVRWDSVNLAVIDWLRVRKLGDEQEAHKRRASNGVPYTRLQRLEHYEAAVRANRQLSTVLRGQGLAEYADYYAYRGKKIRIYALWREAFVWDKRRPVDFVQRLRDVGGWIGSLLVYAIAGYGYRPWRSFVTYVAVVAAFALAFFLLGPSANVPLSPIGAAVFSVTSFHGRGFFPGGTPGHAVLLDDWLSILSALEAFVGLLVEITFIATFTQRFLSR